MQPSPHYSAVFRAATLGDAPPSMSAVTVSFGSPDVGRRCRVGGAALDPALPALKEMSEMPRLSQLNPAEPAPTRAEREYADACFDTPDKLRTLRQMGRAIVDANDNLVTYVRHYLPYCSSEDAGEPTVEWRGVRVGRRDVFNAKMYLNLIFAAPGLDEQRQRFVVSACKGMFDASVVGAGVRRKTPHAVPTAVLLMEVNDATVTYEAEHGDGAADLYYALFTFEDPNLLLRLPGARMTFEHTVSPDELATSRRTRRRRR